MLAMTLQNNQEPVWEKDLDNYLEGLHNTVKELLGWIPKEVKPLNIPRIDLGDDIADKLPILAGLDPPPTKALVIEVAQESKEPKPLTIASTNNGDIPWAPEPLLLQMSLQ